MSDEKGKERNAVEPFTDETPNISTDDGEDDEKKKAGLEGYLFYFIKQSYFKWLHYLFTNWMCIIPDFPPLVQS